MLSGCYECSRNCVNDQFCEQNGHISLPNHLKIKIIANPAFWGFNDGSGNILTSGDAFFSNGHYDFFDGYDEIHFAMKDCGGIVTGPYKDENRPDVLYRSVYDPDDASLAEYGGRRNYGEDGNVDNIERGGAEVYLVDRLKLPTVTSDLPSCDTSDPRSVYKTFPENFGFGTKISTTDTVFKNKTGAWRYIDFKSCNTTFVDSGVVPQCDRTPKQEILRGDYYGSDYDPFQIRVSGEAGCVPDGHMPSSYEGTVYNFSRPSGVEDFINLTLQYNSAAASGLNNGQVIGINGDYLNNAYNLFDVSYSGNYTLAKLVGTLASGYVNETGLNYWTALGTYDPNSCCGGFAYNVSNDTKKTNNVKNYHTDFGRIFNNNKNILQSNRLIENRYDYDLGQPDVEVGPDIVRTDTTYPSITSTGVPLVSGFPVFERELPYYGAFYNTDRFDTAVRSNSSYNTTKGNNGTCYSKKAGLSVYPDCFTQYNKYTPCKGPDKYLINQASRLAIVYKGCNFEDECYFSESGHPYVKPTGIEDLKRGLAGQEVYMYINLDQVWGANIYNEPCGCETPAPPGKLPPEMIWINSPVTFPTFPKFDLYPEDYGCHDLLWQYKWASECEGAILNECPIPSSAYACLPKQPYTTYGFIRNLCGNEYHDRRQVITSAFANLIQDGDYRNTGVAPTAPQPMYWNHTNPYIHESGRTGGFSASGDYPFWGLSDNTGRLVAPYFRGKPDVYTENCKGETTPYLNFDLCATRASGWPTDSVPFLVEIDHADDCIGCGSIEATQSDLVLETVGLNTTFSHARGEKYGWNHCRYKGMSFDPTYTCPSGFNSPCSGLASGFDLLMATNPYVGNTCSCLSDTFQLRNIPLKGTDVSAGWTTWNVNNSYIDVPECAQGTDNDYFSTAPSDRPPGFSVYTSFKLACEGAHDLLIPADATGIMKNYLMMSQITGSQNLLDLIYMNAGCGHHFPSAASDLTLESSFVLVPSGNEQIFELIPEHLMMGGGGLGGIGGSMTPAEVLSALAMNHVFGCNTYYREYGCASTNEYGQASFYPCGSCIAGSPNVTPICDCALVTCNACDDVISTLPPEYMNPCLCDCSVGLMRETLIDFDGNKTIIFETGVLCDSVGGPTSGVVVAVSYSGEYSSVGLTYLNSNTQIPFSSLAVNATAESACSWHTGPNMLATGIYYEYQNPYRLKQGSTFCDTLIPELCHGDCANDSRAQAGACGDPIPWSGAALNNGVSVNLKSCFPETMIVNKIECVGDTFNLYVAREYHSRTRKWEDPAPAASCKPKQIGAYRYGTTCVEIPFCTPSDSVTPAYYSVPVTGISGTGSYRGVCSAHYSSGIFANQDFILSDTAIAEGEDRLWNYFNLFYESGVPSSKYYPAIDLGNPDAETPVPPNPCLNGTSYSDDAIFGTGAYFTPANRLGVDWTNRFHSCLQDHTECGSDFYCNKMFFPRRKYAVGTKVSRFGALQLCTSDSSLVLGDWYTGWQSYENDGYPDITFEAENTRFIHSCDETVKTTVNTAVGIDDVVINVVDYLPLIGINTSLFRYESDIKTCTIISTGCHILNLHSQQSIDGGIHGPKTFLTDGRTSMGYYLDKTTTVESDNCLFNPFKILVDVECCESVLRRRDIQSDPPTMLEYVLDGVPSVACGGFIKQPPCSCGTSTCGGTLGYYQLAPNPVCLTLSAPRSLYSEVVGSGISEKCDKGCGPCCEFGSDGEAMSLIVQDGPEAYGYNTVAGEILYEIGTVPTPVGCSCPLGYYNKTALPIAGVQMICDGDSFISSHSITVPAYQCGEFLYFSAVSPTGCCATSTLCDVLADSWKLRIGDCAIVRLADKTNNLADYLNDCGCLEAEKYTACDTSLLHVTITEAM